MKKITLIGISILSVFILCSLSYQPIIADIQIESKPIIVDDTKRLDVEIEELKDWFIKLYNEKYQSDDDCDCKYKTQNIVKQIICGLFVLFMMPLGIVIMLLPFGFFAIEDVLIIAMQFLQNIYYYVLLCE